MTFDDIMERSGLDPNTTETTLLLDFDDVNFDGATGADLLAIAIEAKQVKTDVFDPRALNLLIFVCGLLLRVNEPDMKGVFVFEPASRLQRKRSLRDCN